ncbi:MAG: DinB family protein, partial [Vicinamibacterales bacterium]
MQDMLRDLIAHKGYANAALLAAVREAPPAASDAELLALLHHILLANRFWLLAVLGHPFIQDEEAAPAPSFEALVQRYRQTQIQEASWLATATDRDLARMLEDTRIPG